MAEYTFHPSVSQHADTRGIRASAQGRGRVDQALRDHEGLIHAAIRCEGSGTLSYEEALQARWLHSPTAKAQYTWTMTDPPDGGIIGTR